MARPKRSSALKAATSLSSTFEKLKADFGDDQEEEKRARRKAADDDEPVALDELDDDLDEDDEGGYLDDEDNEDLVDESGMAKVVLMPAKKPRGRPRKNANPPPPPPSPSPSSPARKRGRPPKNGPNRPPTKPPKYVPLTRYTRYPPGPHPMDVWRRAVRDARPLSRGANKAMVRPPTELLQLKDLPTVEQLPLFLEELAKRSTGRAELSVHPVDDVLNVGFGSESLELRLLESKSVQEGASVTRAGRGAVTGLGWCRCCSRLLASSTYPSPTFRDTLSPDTTADASIHIWRLVQDQKLELVHTLEISGSGPVRRLEWYPYGNPSSRILAATFADKSLRVLALPPVDQNPSTTPIRLEGWRVEDVSCFAWSPHAPSILFTGSHSGLLTTWDLCPYTNPLPNPNPLRLSVARVTASGKPITSLSPNPTNPALLAVGSHEQSLVVLDLADPHRIQRPLTLAYPVTSVEWVEDGIIFWDAGSTLRLHPPAHQRRLIIPFHFSSAIMSMATSPLHNVMAGAAADGSLHFSILQQKKSTGEIYSLEWKLLKHGFGEDGSPQIDVELGEPPSYASTLTTTIHDLQQGISRLAWSPSPLSPGLLAIGTGSGLIILLPLDQHLLAK